MSSKNEEDPSLLAKEDECGPRTEAGRGQRENAALQSHRPATCQNAVIIASRAKRYLPPNILDELGHANTATLCLLVQATIRRVDGTRAENQNEKRPVRHSKTASIVRLTQCNA